MGLLNFVNAAMGRKMEDVSSRAQRAGAAGVDAARAVCPVRTGRLRASIGYLWRQSDTTLTLYADEPYAWWVARRSPFMRVGAAAMSRIFTGSTETQFATLPEKYRPAAKLLAGSGTTIGHRTVKKVR